MHLLGLIQKLRAQHQQPVHLQGGANPQQAMPLFLQHGGEDLQGNFGQLQQPGVLGSRPTFSVNPGVPMKMRIPMRAPMSMPFGLPQHIDQAQKLPQIGV